MIGYDLHMHTSFSGDSVTPPERQIEEAIRLGAKGICFTDHMDYSYPMAREAGTEFVFDAGAYYKRMSELRDEYKDRLEVLIGIEYGLRNEPDLIDEMKEKYGRLNEEYDLDFTIGSTHCLEYTDPYYAVPYWVGKNLDEGMEKYFTAIAENANLRATVREALDYTGIRLGAILFNEPKIESDDALEPGRFRARPLVDVPCKNLSVRLDGDHAPLLTGVIRGRKREKMLADMAQRRLENA